MRYAFTPAQVVPSGSNGGLIAAARLLGRERPDAAGGRYIGFYAEQREPDMAKGPAWIKYTPVLIRVGLFA